jgi:site-specific DNA recombinase
MKKSVIYVRQSLGTDKQPHSIIMQRDMALEYAEKRDWIIHDVYDEGNLSARKTNIEERPELRRLLNDVEAGKIQRILVFKRDRLARKVQQYIEIYRLIRKHDVELHFVADNEPPPFEGAASEFIEAILAGIAEHEANNIVQRLIYSKIPLIQKGLWQVGNPPYAYKSIKTKKKDGSDEEKIIKAPIKDGESNLKFVPEKVETVKALYYEVYAISPYIVDKQDYNLFCKVLQENEKLASLSPKQIWEIITQTLHIGKMVQKLDGEMYEIDNEVTQKNRILPKDKEFLWHKANEIIKQMNVPDSYKRVRKEEDDDLPVPKLENVLFCGTCNQPMLAISKVYKCKTKTCKNSPKINTVDDEVLQRVWNDLLQRGDQHWGKVKAILKKKYSEPFKARIKHLNKELLTHEQEIKEHFRKQLVLSQSDNDMYLSHLVNRYKETAKEHEMYESLLFHVGHFINNLDKEKTIGQVTEMRFTEIQKINILSLVEKVYFVKKKSTKLICYEPNY